MKKLLFTVILLFLLCNLYSQQITNYATANTSSTLSGNLIYSVIIDAGK